MKIVESRLAAYAQVAQWRQAGARVGLVPTMGALHEGHLTLVARSRDRCDKSVATIFVNPTQFAAYEDLSRYPRTLEDDLNLLREHQTDLVFVPSPDEIYPPGYSTFVQPPAVALPLEGEFRPEHFRGVVTIVLKLFHIVPATIAYFGQKDFQQLTVIRQMVEDLNVPIEVEGCPTVREHDGLAMSSRNRYLSAAQREIALSISRALRNAAEQAAEQVIDLATERRSEHVPEQVIEQAAVQSAEHSATPLHARVADVRQLEHGMQQIMQEAGIDRIDYARIVDRRTLEPLSQLDRPAVALIAAYVGSTRLIDNVLL